MILTVDYHGYYLAPSVVTGLVLHQYTTIPTWICIAIALIGIALTVFIIFKFDLPMSSRDAYRKSVETEIKALDQNNEQ